MQIRSALSSVCLSALVFAASALAQKSTIQGIAADIGGKPLKNAEVRIQNEKSKTVPVMVKTDAKGHFVAADMPAGVYTVSVVLNGTVKWSAAHVKAASGKVVQLNLSEHPAVAVAAAGTQPKKHAVWIPDQTGSHLGGHWEDQPYQGPAADNVDAMGAEQLRRMQNVPPAVSASGGR